MLLDDLDYIAAIDRGDMMASVRDLPQHIRDTLDAMNHISVPEEYSECKNIITVGMGGSGIPGDFLRAIYWAECSIPVFVHKDYGLPRFVDSDTLVLAVSYSGTTEETIAAFHEARRRKAKVFGISSGDQLLTLLKQNKVPCFAPPAGRTTRESFGYLLFSMIKVLEKSDYIPDQDPNNAATISLLEDLALAYAPEVPTNSNEAKRIATRLHNRIPVLYASADITDVVGLRWKQQINENSKVFAQLEIFPEATHNQLAAIANPFGMERELCAVILRNKHERPELSRRIDATREVLASRGIDIVEHRATGTTLMANLVSQSYLGDFVSLYLAVLNGVDPTPTIGMSELKKKLGLTDLSPR
jgi:glucose/mannose-6-phosphate isomerase